MLAHLVLELESKMIGEAGSEMKMVYLNAVPRDHYGYNAMTSAEERVRVSMVCWKKPRTATNLKKFLSRAVRSVPCSMKFPMWRSIFKKFRG